jgi:hypothetical protein
MAAPKPQSTIDTVRTLTSQIDPSIEALMESHDFIFTKMTADDSLAHALYCRTKRDETSPWQLTVSHFPNGETRIGVTRMEEENQQISLSILVGTDLAQTLAEAVGLAVSFVSIADQIKASSHA